MAGGLAVHGVAEVRAELLQVRLVVAAEVHVLHAQKRAVRAGGGHVNPVARGPRAAHVGAVDVPDGRDPFVATELIGHGVNGVTGDYSRGASGFRIVNGQIAGPVAEFTVAGNLIDMFAALTPANDLEWYRGINVPTIRVDGMTIAGD